MGSAGRWRRPAEDPVEGFDAQSSMRNARQAAALEGKMSAFVGLICQKRVLGQEIQVLDCRMLVAWFQTFRACDTKSLFHHAAGFLVNQTRQQQ
jgi:hypothetical protein